MPPLSYQIDPWRQGEVDIFDVLKYKDGEKVLNRGCDQTKCIDHDYVSKFVCLTRTVETCLCDLLIFLRFKLTGFV